MLPTYLFIYKTHRAVASFQDKRLRAHAPAHISYNSIPPVPSPPLPPPLPPRIQATTLAPPSVLIQPPLPSPASCTIHLPSLDFQPGGNGPFLHELMATADPPTDIFSRLLLFFPKEQKIQHVHARQAMLSTASSVEFLPSFRALSKNTLKSRSRDTAIHKRHTTQQGSRLGEMAMPSPSRPVPTPHETLRASSRANNDEPRDPLPTLPI